jgi:hypothetical protein
MSNKPVYPKQDLEYEARVKQEFYKRIKNIKWDTIDEGEYCGKPRGRKVKFVERPKAQLRPGEGYNWFKNNKTPL